MGGRLLPWLWVSALALAAAGLYVGGAYGLALALIGIEPLLAWHRRKARVQARGPGRQPAR